MGKRGSVMTYLSELVGESPSSAMTHLFELVKKYRAIVIPGLGLFALFVFLALWLEYGGHILYSDAIRQIRETEVPGGGAVTAVKVCREDDSINSNSFVIDGWIHKDYRMDAVEVYFYVFPDFADTGGSSETLRGSELRALLEETTRSTAVADDWDSSFRDPQERDRLARAWMLAEQVSAILDEKIQNRNDAVKNAERILTIRIPFRPLDDPHGRDWFVEFRRRYDYLRGKITWDKTLRQHMGSIHYRGRRYHPILSQIEEAWCFLTKWNYMQDLM